MKQDLIGATCKDYDKIAIGQRIKQIRLDKGMTTKEFGKLFGATDSNVSSWERGRTSPNPERLKAIAEIGDMSVEELLSREDDAHMKKLINKVKQWFIDRNLQSLDGSGQLIKLQEEVDELKDAYIQADRAAEIDAVGDVTVVLIGYCMQRNLDFEECLRSAYEEIKDRKGKVIDGVFVKEA